MSASLPPPSSSSTGLLPPPAPAPAPAPAPFTMADPFVPDPSLLAAAPPATVRRLVPQPAQPAPTPSADEADLARPTAKPHKPRRTGQLCTLPARIVAFAGVPVTIAASLAAGAIALNDVDRSADPSAGWSVAAVAMVAGMAAAYLGLLWWMVAAAINARRVTQMAVSPLTPLFVLVLGPALLLGGGAMRAAAEDGTANQQWVATAIILAGIFVVGPGHLILLGAYRSTADRLGAARTPWSVLIWLPLFAALIQATLTVLVYPQIDSDRVVVFIWLLSMAFAAAATVGYVLSMWRAMASFDHACRRDRSLEKADVLPGHFVYGRL